MKKFLAVLLPMCMLSAIMMACEAKETLPPENTKETTEEVASDKTEKKKSLNLLKKKQK